MRPGFEVLSLIIWEGEAGEVPLPRHDYVTGPAFSRYILWQISCLPQGGKTEQKLPEVSGGWVGDVSVNLALTNLCCNL